MFLHDNSQPHASKITTAKLPEYIYISPRSILGETLFIY